MTPIYKTWLKRINEGVFTKSQCNQFASAVFSLANHEEPRGKRTNVTPSEARALCAAINSSGGVSLTPEHDAAAREWLFSRDGRKQLPDEAREKFSHFTFNGEGEFGRYHVHPIWRIHLTDGWSIDYYTTPWQSRAYGEAESGHWYIRSTAQV